MKKSKIVAVGLSLFFLSSLMAEAHQKDDLSVPMAKLLYPALKWKKKSGTAEKCLEVGRLKPENPDALYLIDSLDLPGEWFTAVSATGSPTDSSSGHVAWDFRGILKEAGYRQTTLPIKDMGIVVEGQQADGPDGGIEGWVKRAGTDIRLILISNETEGAGDDETVSSKVGPTTYQVFISNITPLQPIAKMVLGK